MKQKVGHQQVWFKKVLMMSGLHYHQIPQVATGGMTIPSN